MVVCLVTLVACSPSSGVDGGVGGGSAGGAAQAGGNGSGGGGSCLIACSLTTCGDVPDACGGVLRCGGCPQGETCGGSGLQNVCGVGTCTPTSCQAAGKNCGQLSDGCGALLDCGTCTSGTTCGAQSPNVCGSGTCTPKTCQELGNNCGSVSDGCGQTIACGSCGSNETCSSANVCQPSCPRGCPAGYACDARGICTGGAGTFAVDLITHAVQGTVTVNGVSPTVAPPSVGTAAQVVVVFTNKQTGARSATTVACPGAAGQPCPASFTARLFPGAYRVSVFASGLVELPSVPVMIGLQGLALPALADLPVSGPATGVMLNVVTVPTQLTITVNGAAPTNTSMNPRNITLFASDTATGALTSFIARCAGGATGVPCPLTATARLPPGPHRIVRLSNSLFPELPIGADVHVDSPVFTVAAAQATHTIDLAPLTVRGTLTVNGDAGVGTSTQTATVGFSPVDGGSTLGAFLQCPQSGRCESNFSTRVFPGAYRVTVRADVMEGFPRSGTFVVAPALAVTPAMAPLAIDVPTVRVSGRVLVNGAAPARQSAAAPLTTLDVSLTDTVQPMQRSSFSIDCSDALTPCTGAFTEPVFRGRALASVGGLNVATMPGVPASSPGLPLDATVPRPGVVLDVPTTSLQGTVTVNGMAPTISSQAADGGVGFGVRLSRPESGEQLAFASPCPSPVPQASCPITFGAPAFQGTTLTAEASAQGFNELPFVLLGRPVWPLGRVFPAEGAITIGAAPVSVTLDVKTARLRGTVTVNGATPQRMGTASPALLQLTNRATGAVLTIGLSCAAMPAPPACALSFDTLVPRGVYEVALVPQTLTDVAGGPFIRWVIGDPVELR